MNDRPWWQTAVFYQIYPRSFADSNGDGIGDLNGIFSKLDYLQNLGIDAIWLSPQYPSPLFDCGYDIADYTSIAPEYGSLEDFKRLLSGLHQHGIRLILDLVLNHTSDQHPWFSESRSNRLNSKRDWYIWRDSHAGGPPNNWQSTFGGSAWEFDAASGQYYYHFFFKQQPDLNWRNPEVREAMFEAARFWLNLGVDGFRLDAIGTIFEHPGLPNHPARRSLVEIGHDSLTATSEEERIVVEEEWKAMFQYQVDQPEVHELMQSLRCVVDEYKDRVLIGEDENLAYHGDGSNELHMVFNFPMMNTDRLTPAFIRSNQAKRLSTLHAISPSAWPCNTLGNHDSPRVYSHYGDGKNDEQLARLHLALLLTLRGTPFLYNGEEIGMTDLYLTDVNQFRDMLGVWAYRSAIQELGFPSKQAIYYASRLTRDKCRTPLQWTDQPNAGFSPPTAQIWLPVNPNYTQGVSVAAQNEDTSSLLNYYRRLLNLRRSTPALISGDYLPLLEESQDCLAYLRHLPEQTCLVTLNFTPLSQTINLEQLLYRQEALFHPSGNTLFSSNDQPNIIQEFTNLTLSPFEVFIAELTQPLK